MTVAAFLRDLTDRDIRITRHGDRLQLSAAEGALTAELRAEIGARKAEILTFLRETPEQRETDFVLRPAPTGQHLPLSFAQQRLWFLHQLDPNDPVYNLGVSVQLPGSVDVPALTRALEALAGRHDILRTVFREINGVPSQVITNTLPTLQTIDLTHMAEDRRAEEVRSWRDAQVKRPFALADAPPVRAAVIRVTGESSLLVVFVHHILADGWSFGLLVEQLRELYETFRAGKLPAPTAIPWQYADYAYSEQVWFETSNQPAREYWKQKLSGSLSSLDLPLDRPRGPVLGSQGEVEKFTVSPAHAEQLRALSRRSGVTLFTTLLTLFKTLLHRYSGQTDILVGTPVANRKQVELESLIGFFVSTLVLRTDLSGDPSFRELLRRVHTGMLDAHEHQDYPFEKIVDLARADRSLANSPLFQTGFIFQNTPRIGTYDTLGGGAVFELSLHFWDEPDALTGLLEYNTDLFDADTIVRMLGHLHTLAEAAVANPDQRLSQLPILTAGERVQMLEAWNDSTTAYPRDQAVHTLFEQQADATPNAVAIIAPRGDPSDSAQQVTYRQLDQLSNRLAHRLRRRGVTPGSTVGIALNRSVDFVVAVLAALKNGAAYVPLDPALPMERLVTMVEDAEPSILLTSTPFRTHVPETHAQIICLDDTLDDTSSPSVAEPDTRLDLPVRADTLAYLMYTSGSTGRPKGVEVPHRAIVRLVRNTNYVTLTERDVILACAPVSFDASTFEIWGSLLNGGTLVIYPRPIPEPEELAQAIRRYGVTTLWLTAGLFHLVAETKPEAFTGLRQLLAGGDVLSPVHVRKALRALAGGTVINGYGPTENTTFTCCYPMTDEHQVDDSIPIGRPIANTRVYVLDAAMQPVPVGVRGELWTGGDGVALGYRNDPQLTSARFLPDPFSTAPASRMYRTGDIVRYRRDGVLEFLGRVDKQVKIRGFRIEPGEIEQTLCQYPAVSDAVVVAREHSAGNKQLVAYIVPAKRQHVSFDDIKRFLQQRLPDYSVPSAYAVVDAFPLTQNGKVDYDALRLSSDALSSPSLSSTESTEDSQDRFSPPTGLETQLIIIWEHVLGVSGIGRHDNFFDLGGNSFLGLRLLANLEKALGRRAPVSVLFKGQTVKSMAVALREEGGDVSCYAVVIQPGGSRPPVFVVPGVNGNVIGYEKLARALGTDQRIYGLRSVGLEGEAAPLDRAEKIAAHFLSEIQRVQPHGPYRLVGFCMGGIIAYEIARQLAALGESVELLGLIDTWPPTMIPDKLWTSRLGQQVVFLSEGIARHVRALWRQPRGQRLQYLREKAGIISEMVAQRDVYRGERYVLYSDLVMRVNQHAASCYTPTPYPGSVLLVFSSEGTPLRDGDVRLMWSTLAQGGSTVVSIPGTDSGSLLKPPFVQGLATVLRQRLEDAAVLETSPA